MSKLYEYLNDPDHKCTLCGITFPFLLIENTSGEKYCSEQCKRTDEDIARIDN